jgi:hypothetical protein
MTISNVSERFYLWCSHRRTQEFKPPLLQDSLSGSAESGGAPVSGEWRPVTTPGVTSVKNGYADEHSAHQEVVKGDQDVVVFSRQPHRSPHGNRGVFHRPGLIRSSPFGFLAGSANTCRRAGLRRSHLTKKVEQGT